MTIHVDTRLTVSANEADIAAAVASIGIVTTALWGCRAELADGSLVRLLPDWKMNDVEAHSMFTPGRQRKPAARAFVDYLVTEFRRKPRQAERA